LRVLYVTGFADPSGQIDPGSGDDPLIKKPFRFSELRDQVQLALKRPPNGPHTNVVRLEKQKP
jgi:hypothetical protein